ncbi:tRNA (N6-threonylcarbamoyladenosine(37)-N6)-methyltransferase TrmO [Vibrio sp.]|uniref:tRNA (N6-threonylcarbamoyladenosine(37)-N6)-methyltransferase TrmO n=1 Tax=Vibrio sp. TaxID=678 RepID=UPI003D106FF9
MKTSSAEPLNIRPIGRIKTEVQKPPRHWSVSNEAGTLIIDPDYTLGLTGIKTGDKIVVLFYFDRSEPFTPDLLLQQPPHHGGEQRGVFATCSPKRPNPLGISILKVTAVRGNRLDVVGVDMHDGTPILDVKPHVARSASKEQG